MGAFEYTALDSQGRKRKGVIEGDTARTVRVQLREQKLTPLTVDEVHRRGDSQVRRRVRRGISAADLALLTRQLATLVGSGLPVEEALGTVANQTEKSRIKSIVLGVRARVVEGHALAAALSDFPNAFPELYRATISAGEQSGHLDAVLERLADFTEARQAVGQRTWLALLYPGLITLVALLVVGALLVYVVPQVVQVFQGTGQQLPWLTRALISVSTFLQQWGLILLALLISGGIVLRSAQKTRPTSQIPSALIADAPIRTPRAGDEYLAFCAYLKHPRRQQCTGIRGAADLRGGIIQPRNARRD